MGNSLKHTSWPGKKWEITWNIWEITWKWEITWNKWEITWTWNKWEITSNIRAGREENRQPDQNLEKRQNQCSGHGGHFNTRKFMATLVLTFHPCLNLSVKKCFSYFRVGKMKLHSSWKKILFGHPWKKPSDASERVRPCNSSNKPVTDDCTVSSERAFSNWPRLANRVMNHYKPNEILIGLTIFTLNKMSSIMSSRKCRHPLSL